MKSINFRMCLLSIACGLGSGFFPGAFLPMVHAASAPGSGEPSELVHEHNKALPLNHRDYSFGYWLNGYRKHKSDTSKDILCLETGYFGLAMDMARLDQAKFGQINDELDYTGALAADGSRMSKLENAGLNIELEKDGKVFRAVSCRAAKERLEGSRFQGTRLWESARYVQNYEIQGLEFQADDGETLVTDSRLNVVAWPNSLSLTAEVAPAVTYKTGPELGVNGQGICLVETPHRIAHQPGLEHGQFTLESWIKVPEVFFQKGRGWILCKNQNEITEGNYGLLVVGGQVRATMNIGGRGRRNIYTVKSDHHSLIADKWHHLAMTYDGKTLSLYMDGNLKESMEIGKQRILGNGPLSLGQRADGHGGMTPVIIDQIRVWSRALDRNELIQHSRKPAELKNRNGLAFEDNCESGEPVNHPVWENTRMSIRFKGPHHDWYAAQLVPEKWGVGNHKKVTVNCNLVSQFEKDTRLTVDMKLNELPPVVYDKQFNCYVARVSRPKRDWQGGYNENRNYDDIDITIDSQHEKTIPFLLEMFHPASITGLCPVLCDEHGEPTGVPVQLSKNWHYQKTGAYLRAYALLPTIKGQKKYKLRIVYGFYGKVPSASHAQLSLVGYGGNGRWDQLAIGSWGETYCMDMDMSCVDVAVTDVRMLMARNGVQGKQWSWTDAGWGGDWLGLNDTMGEKYLFNGVKTAYLSHGPCLTEVKYDGFYGAGREIGFTSTVRTLRTDDHARTFTTIKYVFDKPVKAGGWLFKMGRTGGYVTPRIAYGNSAGLIKEHQVPNGLKKETTFIPKTTLTGSGPWWVSFPGAYSDRGKDWGTGYRAMVIRAYKANIGGKVYTNPTVEFPAYQSAGEGRPNIDFLMTAPEGVTGFKPGDTIEFDVEWITLPRVADDYYGPNETFRKHVMENPSSWQTTYREAVGNNLKIAVGGGTLLNNYPVIIQAGQDEVTVDIEGGLGMVPIRFEGLKQAKGYALYQVVDGKEVKLDQSVHGNDFWQTDYHVKTNTFKMTFNLPLDGLEKSKWILRADAPK
ncbi:MAG: LamG domain-containing protein [Akkermansiaceae bacterium]|nr:LamG domain-containing protein [Akkermansiaceae bacterium]